MIRTANIEVSLQRLSILRIEHPQANPLKLSCTLRAGETFPSGLTVTAEIHTSRNVAAETTPLASSSVTVAADATSFDVIFNSDQTNQTVAPDSVRACWMVVYGVDDENQVHVLSAADLMLGWHAISQVTAAPPTVTLFVEKGGVAWASGRDYASGTMVTVGTTAYVASSAHTSGSSTQPGTGASWNTVWAVLIGDGGGATNLGVTLSPTTVVITSDTGTDATIPAADGTNAGLMLPAEKTKLAGVASGATANSSDAALLARANHTGTQAISTIVNLQTTLDGKASTSHTHSIANVTGLQSALDGKAETSSLGDLAFLSLVGASSLDTGAVTEAKIAAEAVTFSKIAPAAIGTGATQLAAGNDSRFHAAVTLASSLGGVFQLSAQQLQAVTDIGADRIVFLDQSANALAYLVVGAGLSISGTTLTAPAGGTGSEIQIRNSVTGEAAAVAGTSVDGTTIILGAADNLGTGTTERLRLRNITAAANGAPQNSSAIAWEGSAWNPSAGASQKIEFRQALYSQQGSSAPAGRMVLEGRANEGTWAEAFSVRFGFTNSGVWTSGGFGAAASVMPFWVSNSTQALQLGSSGGWVLGPFAVRAGGVDATFTADAANVFAFRNGTNAQTVRVYDTFASATDYHRAAIATARATLSGLSGASVTAAGIIPAGAIVVGVTAKVLTAVTGATSWQLGTAADPDRYAATGAIALGSTTDNRNWTSGALECFLTATDLVLTANGSNFTGGSVYISVQYIRGESD